MSHSRKRPVEVFFPLTRRQSLRQIGFGIGATALGTSLGCGLPPSVCGGRQADQRSVLPAATSDAEQWRRALLDGIDTLIVVMLENRSFDHYLGKLRNDPSYPAAGAIDGLRGDETNVDAEGNLVQVARMPGGGSGNVNPRHDFRSVRLTFNDGRNDAFVKVNAGPHQREVMGYLEREQVPFAHALADRFTVCDRWFASYMGQTWPNRFYLHAGTAAGRRDNSPMGFNAPPTIWERMAVRCRSAKNYAAGPVHWYTVGFPANAFSGNDAMVPARIEDFFRDARAGNLPELALIDPDFKVNDGYPTHDLSLSEAFVSSIVRAVAESPQWSRSMLVITYDEHGGYYDHVVPPMTVDPRPEFQQLGFRVPAIVVGPTVWRGGVVSTPFEHVSVAATLGTRFGIESLGARMDATNDLSSCIDPVRLADPTPPPRDLPTVEVNRSALARISGPSSQSEVERALESKSVPADLVDSRSSDERFRSWVRLAQELEAVKITG